MDPAKFGLLKKALLDQIGAWDGSDRGFSDIVRNAIDLDPSVVWTLRDSCKKTLPTARDVRDYFRGWGQGRDLPDDCSEQLAIIRGYFASK